MSVIARINEVADQVANEGMTLRASRIREGAIEVARLGHEVTQLRELLRRAHYHLYEEGYLRISHEIEAALGFRQGELTQEEDDIVRKALFADTEPSEVTIRRDRDEEWHY